MGLLDNLLKTEHEVQSLYSNLSETKSKIEQLGKTKTELENELNKPKANPIEHDKERKKHIPTIDKKPKI